MDNIMSDEVPILIPLNTTSTSDSQTPADVTPSSSQSSDSNNKGDEKPRTPQRSSVRLSKRPVVFPELDTKGIDTNTTPKRVPQSKLRYSPGLDSPLGKIKARTQETTANGTIEYYPFFSLAKDKAEKTKEKEKEEEQEVSTPTPTKNKRKKKETKRVVSENEDSDFERPREKKSKPDKNRTSNKSHPRRV
eukprot:TRINITY_DN3469_c0_g3_i1.p2 TRINITY_DN3469_c0_g3~~TRINITY_DN3469_c0_g3_i1.p2  ORF type:complete len:191 (-),score=51.14 TRINITY_DN3469_c0_g3_i1:254-826(-)